MSDLEQGTPAVTEGQTAAVPEGQAAPNPEVPEGQAEHQQSAGTGQAPAPAPEDTFFDPSQIPPELMPAYKSMQKAYTQKTMKISEHRQKIEAYDQFMRDPITNLQNLAGQYGMTLSRGEAKQVLQQSGQQTQGDVDWDNFQPKNWGEAFSAFKQKAFEEWSQQIQPLVGSVQKMQTRNVEAELSKIDPQWKLYEDEMSANLQAHPTLVKDIDKLYMLSVPREVWTARATQSALKKVEASVQAAQVSGKGQTSKTVAAPKKATNFNEAVQLAKEQLAQQGIRP
jgi:hypothetical protein